MYGLVLPIVQPDNRRGSLIPPYTLSLVWECPHNLQAERAVMYNPYIPSEWQMRGKYVTCFVRPTIHHDMANNEAILGKRKRENGVCVFG